MRDLTEKYGIGIWGAGLAGSDHLAAYLNQEDCRIVAIGSLHQSDAKILAERFGARRGKRINNRKRRQR